MDMLRRWLLALLFAVTAVPAAAVVCPIPVPPAATAEPDQTAARSAWWNDHRWRYRSDREAEVAYEALRTTEAPWPIWHQSHIVTLPVGLRIEIALGPEQPSECPGAFGTFERIPSVEYVRLSLAVKSTWKRAIERVVTYEVRTALLADVGMVGPQIDVAAGRYLPGGASQFQMLVPASERMRHLRIVDERPIR